MVLAVDIKLVSLEKLLRELLDPGAARLAWLDGLRTGIVCAALVLIVAFCLTRRRA